MLRFESDQEAVFGKYSEEIGVFGMMHWHFLPFAGKQYSCGFSAEEHWIAFLACASSPERVPVVQPMLAEYCRAHLPDCEPLEGSDNPAVPLAEVSDSPESLHQQHYSATAAAALLPLHLPIVWYWDLPTENPTKASTDLIVPYALPLVMARIQAVFVERGQPSPVSLLYDCDSCDDQIYV